VGRDDLRPLDGPTIDFTPHPTGVPGEGPKTFTDPSLITIVCLLPEFLILKWNVPFYFGGTSLLIIVVVTMDFMTQVQAYAMSHQYESLLKKANFKGSGLPVK